MLSFDPDTFNRYGSDNKRSMTPSDLVPVVQTIESDTGAIVVQLSTYDVNNDNGQVEVERAVDPGLQDGGLNLVTVVRTDGRMMSLVLARGCSVPFVSEVAELTWRVRSVVHEAENERMVGSQPTISCTGRGPGHDCPRYHRCLVAAVGGVRHTLTE